MVVSKQQRVLVAGGAGFVGSHLCDHFLEKGYFVLCVDNLITGTMANIGHLRDSERFSFLNQDITKPFAIEGPLDFILNMASPASPVDYQKYPIETLKVGAFGTWNLLELSRQKKARFLQASTSEVYGDPKVHPQTEEYWGNVNPVGPRSCYDEAKRYAESLVLFFHQTFKVETRIARIFNTYGPRMRLEDGRALPNFITQALQGREVTVYGDGSQTRSFCYMDDMVSGLEKLLFSDEVMPVNLGNPAEQTLLKTARIVLDLVQGKSKIVYHPLPKDDPKVRRPDISKAKRLLGWEPTVDFETGLKKTIAYFATRLERAKRD